MSRNKPLKASSRNKETREAKSRQEQYNHIAISFRYFQNFDNNPIQSLQNWNEDNRLLDMLLSFEYICKNNIVKLQSTDRKLTLYGDFPNTKVNDFPLPDELNENENWGTIRNIGGQKARIAGFLRDNIFYIVYLDKEHRFYKSEKQ